MYIDNEVLDIAWRINVKNMAHVLRLLESYSLAEPTEKETRENERLMAIYDGKAVCLLTDVMEVFETNNEAVSFLHHEANCYKDRTIPNGLTIEERYKRYTGEGKEE